MKLEIYYDFLCEFCDMGHRVWTEVLPDFPNISPVYRPCEAHPREVEPGYGMHSDIAAQGLYCVLDSGNDAHAYNAAVFEAAWRHGQSLEDIGVLARCASKAGADEAAFTEALRSGAYAQRVQSANNHAWGTLALPAVPSFVLEDGRVLEALPLVGVTRERLVRFLQSVT